jgi:hypothetical protein
VSRQHGGQYPPRTEILMSVPVSWGSNFGADNEDVIGDSPVVITLILSQYRTEVNFYEPRYNDARATGEQLVGTVQETWCEVCRTPAVIEGLGVACLTRAAGYRLADVLADQGTSALPVPHSTRRAAALSARGDSRDGADYILRLTDEG